VIVDDRNHPVTEALAPASLFHQCEWTSKASLIEQRCACAGITWFVELSVREKKILSVVEIPVVWTNSNTNALHEYGSADLVMTDSTQNRMIEDAVLWLGENKK
jgi:hypothetical protein